MQWIVRIVAVICMADLVAAQSFSLPDGPPGSSVTTYGQQGRRSTTFKTQTGWVTYGPQGERFETFEKASRDSVTYGSGGQQWETFASPASAFPSKRQSH